MNNTVCMYSVLLYLITWVLFSLGSDISRSRDQGANQKGKSPGKRKSPKGKIQQSILEQSSSSKGEAGEEPDNKQSQGNVVENEEISVIEETQVKPGKGKPQKKYARSISEGNIDCKKDRKSPKGKLCSSY